MDDLKLATVDQLRQQWTEIEAALDYNQQEMDEEEFQSLAYQYQEIAERERQWAIEKELKRRGLMSMYDWQRGQNGGL